jgi:hypothetical protein
MNMFKRFAAWVTASGRRLLLPNFGAAHYPLHASAHPRYPDYRHDGLPNRPRGNYQEDFLGGVPHAHSPNETLAGFPRRSTMIAYHGWRIPTPPQFPVYD